MDPSADTGNLSLFEAGGKLDVVRAEFCGAETVPWEELFEGFDRLYAVTYSSGIGFICKRLKMFGGAEIIFGFDQAMSYSLQEIMAYQLKTVERLRRMLDALPGMLEQLKSDGDAVPPDVLAVSSKVIRAIIGERAAVEIPPFVRELTPEDYFSEKVTGSHAIKTICDAWKINQKAFAVDKKFGQLRYNAGQMWEADRIIKELPEDLEACKSREWAIINLDRACEFFGINFRKKRRFGF